MGRANPLWSAPQRAVVTGLVGALLIVALPGAYAAPTLKKPASQAELLSVLEKMNARLDQLEKRNAELERQLTAPRSATTKDIEQRVQTLEQEQIKLGKGLDSDRISEKEPELTARLKGVEMDVMSMKKAASTIDALEGLSATASLTTVAQKASGLPQGTVDHNSHLGYRADVTVTLPLPTHGDIEQKLFGHFRIGQGGGLNTPFANLGGFASAVNAVAFGVSGAPADDSTALLGEAWYQATIPLPFGGFQPQSKETLELTFGKMDFFSFFDQNSLAGDESRQFLNSVFVHNPLLDAGGQVGVDANGFQPGFVAAYLNNSERPESWRLSLGFFDTERGANYQRLISSPLVIAQAEYSPQLFMGQTGNYRAYVWRNGKGSDFDGGTPAHGGWGMSADQKLGNGIALFGRYGKQTSGRVRFNQALTLGGEIEGGLWDRGGDALGVALGWLRSSQEFRAAGGTGDLIGDGTGVFTYTPTGAEKVAEMYYRFPLTKNFELTPDLQFVRNLGANPAARTARVLGLRAQIAY